MPPINSPWRPDTSGQILRMRHLLILKIPQNLVWRIQNLGKSRVTRKLRENENSGKILGEDSWVGWNYSQSPSVHCNSVFDLFILENISVWALRGHWTPTLPPFPHNPIFFGTRNILNSLFWLVLALFLYTESLRINFLGYSISVCP